MGSIQNSLSALTVVVATLINDLVRGGEKAEENYCSRCFSVGRLGAGTTRMCAGIVSVAKPISIECQMANYSNHLYQGLEEESGVKTGQL